MTPMLILLALAMLYQTALGVYLPQEVSLERRVPVLHNPAKIFNGIRKHIFYGESENTGSGRHMLKAWCSANKSSRGICNTESKLCIFDGKKTVWDDRPGGYTAAHVESLCTTSIAHNVRGVLHIQSGQYAVQTHLKRPICVKHDVHKGQHSCYPVGINFRRRPESGLGSYKIGESCPHGTGNDVDNYSSHTGSHNRGQAINCQDIR